MISNGLYDSIFQIVSDNLKVLPSLVCACFFPYDERREFLS